MFGTRRVSHVVAIGIRHEIGPLRVVDDVKSSGGVVAHDVTFVDLFAVGGGRVEDGARSRRPHVARQFDDFVGEVGHAAF